MSGRADRRPVLVAGCGYTGAVLAAQLAADRPTWGLRQRSADVPEGVTGVRADVTAPREVAAALAPLRGQEPDVVFLLAPAHHDEAGYRTTYVEGLQAIADAVGRIHRLVYASSTAVWGDAHGWVDEHSPPAPSRFSGHILLEAEALAAEVAARCSVVRFGGIYGPGRDRTVRKIIDGQRLFPEGAEAYGNRIHRDDVAGVCRWCLEVDDPAPLYVGVDRAPAPLVEVQRWLCAALGRDEDSLAPASPRSRGGAKRCRGDRLVADGYAFDYPTYREGYGELIARLARR